MALLDWIPFRRAGQAPAPRAAVQQSGGGKLIVSSDDLAAAIQSAMTAGSGAVVTPDSAMRVAAVFACVRIISGTVANLPLHIKRRVDDKTREDVTDHPLWTVFTRCPNGWQTPSQFKRMMQAHLLLRGNAYAMKIVSRGRVVGLIPLHPDRVTCEQGDDLGLSYTYTRKDGRRVSLAQRDMFHLVGLTLDGVHGVSVITYARETIGMALAMENYGATTFRNGARPSNVLTHPGKLGKEGIENLRASLDEYRSGGEAEGKALVLEEGMTVTALSMTNEDAQWIESRKFSRTDIAMFFGMPPHMIGDTEKSTSWGSGIEQQSIGYRTYTAEDHLTTWEETIERDLLDPKETDIFALFNRNAMARSDMKSRYQSYQIGRQIKVLSANDVRALEDMNPYDGGDVYENPAIAVDAKGDTDEPENPA